MVAYNSANYVEAAIESVLVQSLEDFEIIFSDDCSTDETWTLVQQYACDPRVHLYRNAKNLGEYLNRNLSAGYAKGKYLIFVDADNILYPHGLEFMVKYLKAFPEARVTNARWADYRFVSPHYLTPREVFKAEFLGKGILTGVFENIMIETDAFRTVGGCEPTIYTGDHYLLLKLSARYGCLIIPDGMCWWRPRPDQAIQRVLDQDLDIIDAVRGKLDILRSVYCPLTAEESAQALKNVYRTFTRRICYRFLQGRFKHAMNLAIKGGIPLGCWRHVFNRERRPYLNETYGPILPNWAHYPLAKPWPLSDKN
jgi:glycosyltransferase involved in cell wall biosynthesis